LAFKSDVVVVAFVMFSIVVLLSGDVIGIGVVQFWLDIFEVVGGHVVLVISSAPVDVVVADGISVTLSSGYLNQLELTQYSTLLNTQHFKSTDYLCRSARNKISTPAV
jgi:hypothetical protein